VRLDELNVESPFIIKYASQQVLIPYSEIFVGKKLSKKMTSLLRKSD